MVRVCFFCLGNICRSPSAEGVMRHLVRAAGLEGAIEVDSAGTAGYHAGEPPDPRACAAGRRAGIDVCGQARQFERRDFERFDYVVAMDRSNLDELSRLAPKGLAHKLSLLRAFDSAARPGAAVPDPYYGDDAGFDEVLLLCQAACAGLLEHIRREHRL
jgi:protein-tyrosine phosphatase